MNSIGLIVCGLVGCAFGMAILERFPNGISPAFGLLLIALALLMTLPALLLRSDRRAMWFCLFALALLAGCGRALITHPPSGPQDVAYYNRTPGAAPITIVGTLNGEPQLSDRSQRLRVSATNILLPGRAQAIEVHGDVIAVVARYPVLDIGERVVLSGTLTAPPTLGTFDYAGYLARQGVYSYMVFPRLRQLGQGDTTFLARFVADARDLTRQALRSTVPEAEASLAVGVVTGDRTSMSPGLQDAFLRSGTVHVLAISGENIALIVGFVWLLYSRSGRQGRLPTWLTIALLAFLLFYTAFTGATPSVVRATLMAVVLLLAPFVRRRYDPTAALAVAAALMCLFGPNLVFDAGFLLSFGSLLGIALVSPVMFRGFRRIRVPGVLAAAFAASLGAQSVTLPLAAMIGGQISLVSPLATLLIDPALLPLMVIGIATAICYPLIAPLGIALSWVTWACSGWMIWWAQFWASLPGASIDLGSVDPLWVWAYYALFALILMLILARRHGKLKLARPLRKPTYFAFAASIVALWAGFAWVMLAR